MYISENSLICYEMLSHLRGFTVFKIKKFINKILFLK